MKKSLIVYLFIILLSSGCDTIPLQPPKPQPPITAIQEAKRLVGQKQLAEADKILAQYANTWKTLAIRGDIAAYHKQWQRAAQFFMQSLKLSEKIHIPISKREEIEEISQSLQDAQLLAGEMVGPVMPPPSDGAKSIWIKPMPMPVQFDPSKGYELKDITEIGKRSADFLADYIKGQNAEHVILFGHTDETGDAIENQWISEQRADSVRTYLQEKRGVTAKIDIIGKGEDEPLPLPRWKKNLTQEEIYRRNRRVELKLVR